MRVLCSIQRFVVVRRAPVAIAVAAKLLSLLIVGAGGEFENIGSLANFLDVVIGDVANAALRVSDGADNFFAQQTFVHYDPGATTVVYPLLNGHAHRRDSRLL